MKEVEKKKLHNKEEIQRSYMTKKVKSKRNKNNKNNNNNENNGEEKDDGRGGGKK